MRVYSKNKHVIKIEDFENFLLKNTIGQLVNESTLLTKLGLSQGLIINYWKEVAQFIGTENRIALDYIESTQEIIVYEFNEKSMYDSIRTVKYDMSTDQCYYDTE